MATGRDGDPDRRRDGRAALRLMRKLLKKQGFAPKLLVTDKLRSYGSAFQRLRLTCPHEQGLRITTGPKLASGGATTRAQDATLQIGSISPALPQHACRRPQHLQPSAISSRDRRPGSSEPRRRSNGKKRLWRHEVRALFYPRLAKPT
jgi:hypothetical protein